MIHTDRLFVRKIYERNDISLKVFKLIPENVPIARPSGNRELMHKMIIPFHGRFVLEDIRKE